MPEPSVASKLLAEEFGIEYDEGAEGIDSLPNSHHDGTTTTTTGIDIDSEFGNEVLDGDVPNSGLASEFGGGSEDDASNFQDGPSSMMMVEDDDLGQHRQQQHEFEPLDDPGYSSSTFGRKKVHAKQPEQDPLEVLSQDLESMDKFLHHLRRIDVDPSSGSSSSSSYATTLGSDASASASVAASSVSHQISLEKVASDFIRRINGSVRDREGQVRELSVCEREFRKIAGEVGGEDVLGSLDEITGIEELSDGVASVQQQQQDKTDGSSKPSLDPVIEEEPSSPVTPRRRRGLHRRHLSTDWEIDFVIEEEPPSPVTRRRRRLHRRRLSTDWELDPDSNHLGDELEEDEDYGEFLEDDGEGNTFSEATSPVKDAFPREPPPLIGPITPAKTVPQLAHLRTSTSSLMSQLTTMSEHAQVNGAATAESGRKIRALKNKLGGWRMEWDSAERSRQRIEKWEAGILVEGDSQAQADSSPERRTSLGGTTNKRVDGRVVVQEHLRAFELALADAALKTQAIMAIIAR